MSIVCNGNIPALAGGVMVFITLNELIPASREHGHQSTIALGIIVESMFVFIISGCLVFKFWLLCQ
jgi:zinc transporter ZupT